MDGEESRNKIVNRTTGKTCMGVDGESSKVDVRK